MMREASMRGEGVMYGSYSLDEHGELDLDAVRHGAAA